MVTPIKIAVAEPTSIVRSGLETQLRKLLHYKAQIINLLDDNRKEWQDVASVISADIFIINPLLTGSNPRLYLPNLPYETKLLALCYSPYDSMFLKEFDGVISLSDTALQISETIDQLLQNESSASSTTTDSQSLTPREREIIICVVKGMTNKEIAGQLYLSTHTVITHRRNISKKLQIHSPSGLTIYAIMNKLVELEDIKQDLEPPLISLITEPPHSPMLGWVWGLLLV